MFTRSRESAIAVVLTKTVLDITYQHNDISPLIRSVYMFVPILLLIPGAGTCLWSLFDRMTWIFRIVQVAALLSLLL